MKIKLNKALLLPVLMVTLAFSFVANAQNVRPAPGPNTDKAVDRAESQHQMQEDRQAKLDAERARIEAKREQMHIDFEAKREEIQAGIEQRRDDIKNGIAETRAEIKERIESRRMEIKEQLTDRRAEIKSKIEERRTQMLANQEERKAKFAEAQKNRVRGALNNMFSGFDNAAKRLQTASDRIQEHINDFESQGIDVSGAESALVEANGLLESTLAEISSVKDALSSAVEDEVSKEFLRDLVSDAKASIKITHEAYKDVIDILKQEVRNGNSDSSNSDDEDNEEESEEADEGDEADEDANDDDVN